MSKKIMFGFVLVICLMLAATFSFAGCKAEEAVKEVEETAEETAEEMEEAVEEEVEEAEEAVEEVVQYDTLLVGSLNNVEGVCLGYGLEMGYFEEVGLDIEPFFFTNGADINEAIGSGNIDIAKSGGASVFALASGDITMLAESVYVGKMGLYVLEDSEILTEQGNVEGKPDVYGSKDLIEGKTFLGPIGTIAQMTILAYAEMFGLTEDDINVVGMDFGATYQAGITGEGDVIFTAPPFSYTAEQDGLVEICPIEVAMDSLINSVDIVTNDIVQNRRDELVLFYEVIYRCQDELLDSGNFYTFAQQWMAENGRELDDFQTEQMSVTMLPVTAEDMQKPDFILGQGMVVEGVFFTSVGKILEEDFPNIEKSVDDSILEEVLGIEIKSVGE